MTWRQFLATFCAASILVGAVLLAFVVIVDPYDTGRFTPLRVYGMPKNSTSLVTASLARDPAIDGAIVGNSTIQLLNPRRLQSLTGEKLAQLSIPGVGPVEEYYILNWFHRWHSSPKAIIVGLDYGSWCKPDFKFSRANILNPFPFWLYGSDAEYLSKVLSFRSIGDSVARIRMWMGAVAPVDPMRVDDYERTRIYDIGVVRARLTRIVEEDQRLDASSMKKEGGLPPGAALDTLRAALARFSPTTHKVLVFTPVYARTLSTQGTWVQNIATCKAKANSLAATLPNTTVIDFLQKAPLTENDANFWDGIHYREPVAEAIEHAIALALAGHNPQPEIDAALDQHTAN